MEDLLAKISEEDRVEINYENGDKFVGELQNGKPHGYGAYTWTDGAMFGMMHANIFTYACMHIVSDASCPLIITQSDARLGTQPPVRGVVVPLC